MHVGGVGSGAVSQAMLVPLLSARHHLPASAAEGCGSTEPQRQPAEVYCSSLPAGQFGGIIAATCACRLARVGGGDGGSGGGCGGGGGGDMTGAAGALGGRGAFGRRGLGGGGAA
jgi:hypothetical protein